ncbi:MAG: NADPH-dependent FMN reductase [Lutibacter sp.]|uniref:NADPH-dependent FMN reductase n=1 Tax=Lutibacter sp. TaxID=1925666 RepID=UPI00299F3F45|nr:NADPH-dependent FMN reductase [Lutibacter sp.]MDX1829110.1 NADPH-dependent FMN reductase [Lutibacter sp.]
MTKKIITIGGSTSIMSINKILVEYAGSLLDNVDVQNIDLNDFEMPLFSVDIMEKHGTPKAAKKLDAIINNADGILISLTEHNGAYSAAFKNMFDWLSIIDGKVWKDKPMLLLSTSPGVRGGESVLSIALNRFPYNGGNIIGSMPFPSFNENFKNNEIVNKPLKDKLVKLIADFEKAL